MSADSAKQVEPQVWDSADFDPVNPTKAKEEFRNYANSKRQGIVENHYRMMRSNQTVAFVNKMHNKWLSFDKAQMTVWDAFECLNRFVDASDPDTNFPNLEHMLQTAEAIRRDGHPDWFQLTGLIHDLGKIMFLWGAPEDGQVSSGPQWALGGDTFPVGCALSDKLNFPHFNELNPDMSNPQYNTPNGIYEPHCGLDSLNICWGHDEYMYRMLVANNTLLPKEALWMVRYHSFYAWHTHGGYQHLINESDEEKKHWVLEFNKYDLYTKSDERPNAEALRPYYQSLIEKYLPGVLRW